MSICVMPSLVQVPCSLTSFKSCTALHFSSAFGDDSLSYIWKIFPSKNISSGTSFSLSPSNKFPDFNRPSVVDLK